MNKMIQNKRVKQRGFGYRKERVFLKIFSCSFIHSKIKWPKRVSGPMLTQMHFRFIVGFVPMAAALASLIFHSDY
ncbi:MAG TPA: hypothetical protein VL053_17075 [Arachidicoccus sp.]|nr:hypothetical protein [Arachidicoccus sp.]